MNPKKNAVKAAQSLTLQMRVAVAPSAPEFPKE